ncbi:MAG: hypothetical protein ACLPH3_11125 [Terracidiphilus sp.]
MILSVSEEFLKNAGSQLLWELRAHRNVLSKMRIASLLSEPRHQDPKSLVKHGFKVYSQTDEDGIIQEIFRRIGIAKATFVEFGCGNGVENNTVYLLMQGWSGLWMDGDPLNIEAIAKPFEPFLKGGTLRLKNAMITRENINDLLAQEPKEVDLLSIDIDMNDYWVWGAIECIQPRVVVIEYNASLRPPGALVVPYHPDRRWTGTNFFGASLSALEKLGAAKGYALVGCGLTGVNAFFVRHDLLAEKFVEPYTAERHYQPPAYSLFQVEMDSHSPEIGVYKVVTSTSEATKSSNAPSI